MGRAALTVVRWSTPVRQQDKSGAWIPTGRARLTKWHVSIDGSMTACGAWIAPDATVLAVTPNWHLRASCYNCVRRLWPAHKPDNGYIAPVSGKDFPLRRACLHSPGRELDPVYCAACTTADERGKRDPNWPCPNGCGEPHDLLYAWPRCTVRPQRHEVPPGERCTDRQCEAEERVIRNANPGLFIDLSDGAMMSCYHCHHAVCMACQQVPVDDYADTCDSCE
jgi:hypothetical protein